MRRLRIHNFNPNPVGRSCSRRGFQACYLQYRLRNRAAQADNIRAQLSEKQAEVALQNTRNSIGLNVRNTIINLTQARSQVQSSKIAVQFSQQSLDAEQKKLYAGVSTFYNVMLSERDNFAARLSAVQAQVAYAKALVARDLASGQLLDEIHITLDDAIRGEIPSAAHPVR